MIFWKLRFDRGKTIGQEQRRWQSVVSRNTATTAGARQRFRAQRNERECRLQSWRWASNRKVRSCTYCTQTVLLSTSV